MWTKLKEEKELKLRINRQETFKEKSFADLTQSIRADISRCKSEDYEYRKNYPQAKIIMELVSEDQINFKLDETLNPGGYGKIGIEDL